jgi:hypothetical protein
LAWTTTRAHEGARLFRDRLVDSGAEGQFDSMLYGVLRAQWGHAPSLKECYYCTFAGGGGGGEGKGGEGKDGGGADGGMGAGKVLTRVSEEDFIPLIKQVG